MLAERKKEIERRRKWVLSQSVKRWHHIAMIAGKCRQCGRLREINPKTGKLFYLCPRCHAKYISRMAAYVRKRRSAKNGVDLPAA